MVCVRVVERAEELQNLLKGRPMRGCVSVGLGRLLVWSALGLGVALGWSPEASATIALSFDLDAMTTTSDAIVIGQVREVASRWEGHRIVTGVEIAVALPVMGSAARGERVRLDVLGGRVGDLAQVVSGTARFAVGEQVVVFLEEVGGGFQVVGLSQGKYKVVRGPDERLWAVRDLEGLTLATIERTAQGPTARLSELAPEALGAVPLDALLRDVVRGMRRIEVPARPEILECLGEDLTRDFDFGGLLSAPKWGGR